MDKVSIIVPCYNQAQYLNEALESVIHQTYQNWECIIVNDGSPDNTEEITKKWLQKDLRFKYLKIINSGVSAARNLGILKAKGTYILPLDADDKIALNYIELAIEAFSQNKSLKLVYCKAKKFGDVIGEWSLKPYSIKELARSNMIFCSAVYKKKDWELCGRYDSNMTTGLEDWEFWISLLKGGGEVRCLNTVGFYYRIKETSRQIVFNSSDKSEVLEYMSIKHADFFVKQFGSFHFLNKELKKSNNRYNNLIKSPLKLLKRLVITLLK